VEQFLKNRDSSLVCIAHLTSEHMFNYNPPPLSLNLYHWYIMEFSFQIKLVFARLVLKDIIFSPLQTILYPILTSNTWAFTCKLEYNLHTNVMIHAKIWFFPPTFSHVVCKKSNTIIYALLQSDHHFFLNKLPSELFRTGTETIWIDWS